MTTKNLRQTSAQAVRDLVQKWVCIDKSDESKDSVEFEVDLSNQTDSDSMRMLSIPVTEKCQHIQLELVREEAKHRKSYKNSIQLLFNVCEVLLT